jgi:DNA polymerase-3 subunit gamma/tau
MASRLSQRLQGWTGTRWGVSVVSDGGAPTVAELRDAQTDADRVEAMENPLVKSVFAAFSGAKIMAIRTPEAIAQLAATDALPEVEDEWDPFEDE